MINLWSGLVSLVFLLGAPYLVSVAQPVPVSSASVSSAKPPHSRSVDQVVRELAQANVVYLAETHDRPADHQAQLQIIQALHRLRPDLVIAMEMFQQPFQPALDRYLAGQLTETQLQEQTEYQRRWGFSWEFYAPILRFAQTNQVPVVALNLPSEITRKVARIGLESLTAAERQAIPNFILKGPDRYRDRLLALYEEIHQGKGNSASFENFFLAQVLWDETMAERVAKLLQENPKRLVVVLAGQGHVNYGDGIPIRVARRQTAQPIKQRSVLLNPTSEQAKDAAIADYFWYSPPDGK